MKRNKTIFLIRHGESVHNRDGNQLSGVTDVDMSPEGIKQCHLLARYIDRLNIQKVYTSPLSRAIMTAEIIFPKQKVQIDRGLIEFNYGDYEGKIADNHQNDPIINQWNQSPGNLTFPGGDNIAIHADNTYMALRKISHNSKETLIACITHRTSMRLLIAKILGVPLDKFRPIPCSNCGLSEIHVDQNGDFILTSLNITLKYLVDINP